MTVLLVLLFAGIVGVTVWGWVTLGSDQRMRVSLGSPPSVEGTTSKKTWLLLHLAAATVVFSGSMTPDSGLAFASIDVGVSLCPSEPGQLGGLLSSGEVSISY